MGLALSVGYLAAALSQKEKAAIRFFSKEFRAINRALRKHGLPAHSEPETLPKLPYRGYLVSFPYSWLHYLRRIAALKRAGVAITPSRGRDATDYSVLDAAYRDDRCDSHLITHSDSEGYYVPIDFPVPLRSRFLAKIRGGYLGSSIRLLQELRELAPLLDISLEEELLSDEAASRIASEEESAPFAAERKVWLATFENATASVVYKAALAFG